MNHKFEMLKHVLERVDRVYNGWYRLLFFCAV